MALCCLTLQNLLIFFAILLTKRSQHELCCTVQGALESLQEFQTCVGKEMGRTPVDDEATIWHIRNFLCLTARGAVRSNRSATCGGSEFGHNSRDFRGTGKTTGLDCMECRTKSYSMQKKAVCKDMANTTTTTTTKTTTSNSQGCLVTSKYKMRRAGSNTAVRRARGSPASEWMCPQETIECFRGKSCNGVVLCLLRCSEHVDTNSGEGGCCNQSVEMSGALRISARSSRPVSFPDGVQRAVYLPWEQGDTSSAAPWPVNRLINWTYWLNSLQAAQYILRN